MAYSIKWKTLGEGSDFGAVSEHLELALEDADTKIELLSGFERVADSLLLLGPVSVLECVVDQLSASKESFKIMS